MAILSIDCAEDTELLIHVLLDQLDAENLLADERQELDKVEIIRKTDPAVGLSSEPVTIAATITLATLLVPRVARIIERWLEQRHQEKVLKIVAAVEGDVAKKSLAHLAEAHAKVSMSYALEKSPKS